MNPTIQLQEQLGSNMNILVFQINFLMKKKKNEKEKKKNNLNYSC